MNGCRSAAFLDVFTTVFGPLSFPPLTLTCFGIQMFGFEEDDGLHSLLFPDSPAESGLPTHRQMRGYH